MDFKIMLSQYPNVFDLFETLKNLFSVCLYFDCSVLFSTLKLAFVE